jgi:hypothetical protein
MPTQQMDLYAAERLVDDGPLFANVAAVQVWLDGLRDTDWWVRLVPEDVLRVEVALGRPGKGAAGVGWFDRKAKGGRLEFARAAELNERRIVHELSHVIASAAKNSKSHDPWFARIYLELTYLIRGATAYTQLRDAFIRTGIDFDAEGLASQ